VLPYEWGMGRRQSTRHVRRVGRDFDTIADVLPRTYRELLDVIDCIEQSGARADARRWREETIARYSRTWNTATLRWMEARLVKLAGVAADRAERQRRSRRAA
jgi:hypothetical protein